MKLGKIFSDSIEAYEKILDLVLPLGLLVLFVSSFLMLTSTYIAGGAGFVRYTDILYSSPSDAIIIILVAAAGLYAFSFLSVGVSALIKFKRTLDDISFIKLANRATKYAISVSVAWFFLAFVSFLIGVLFASLDIPALLLSLTFIVIWWGTIFLPQVVVLEDLPFLKAFSKSIKYSIKYWPQVLFYYGLATIFVFLILLAEYALEQIPFFYWTAPFISSILLFLIVVPFLEILKCEMYLATKYRITTAGLK